MDKDDNKRYTFCLCGCGCNKIMPKEDINGKWTLSDYTNELEIENKRLKYFLSKPSVKAFLFSNNEIIELSNLLKDE